jgi:hypothetical protein
MKRNNPLIYGIMNNGQKSYNPIVDGEGLYFGACFKDFRGSPKPYWIKVTYLDRTLKVETAHHGDYYELCFEGRDIDLPPGYYFGLTASTTRDFPDQHDIYMFETYELRPNPKDHAVRPNEERAKSFHLSDEDEKKFNQYAHHYDDLHEKHEDHIHGKKLSNDELYYILTDIENNQHEIMAMLGKNSPSYHPSEDAVHVETLEKKMDLFAEHLNALTIAVNKLTSSGDAKDLLEKLHKINVENNAKLADIAVRI